MRKYTYLTILLMSCLLSSSTRAMNLSEDESSSSGNESVDMEYFPPSTSHVMSGVHLTGREALTQTGRFHVSDQERIDALVKDAVDKVYTLILSFSAEPQVNRVIDFRRVVDELSQVEDNVDAYARQMDPATQDFIQFFKDHREEFRSNFPKLDVKTLFNASGNITSENYQGPQKELIRGLIKAIGDYKGRTMGAANSVVRNLYAVMTRFTQNLEKHELISKYCFQTGEPMDIYVDAYQAVRTAQMEISKMDKLSPQYVQYLVDDMKLNQPDSSPRQMGLKLMRNATLGSQQMEAVMKELSQSLDKLRGVASSSQNPTTTTTKPIRRFPSKWPSKAPPPRPSVVEQREGASNDPTGFKQKMELWKSRETEQQRKHREHVLNRVGGRGGKLPYIHRKKGNEQLEEGH